MRPEVARKIDYRLGAWLERSGVDLDEKVPVVMRAEDAAALQSITATIGSTGGSLRYEMEPINAVSAWVRLAAIERLATEPGLLTMELVDKTAIA